MASRCSGPILNCPNHRKLRLRCLFPDTVDLYFQIHPRPSPHLSIHFFNNIAFLSWDVVLYNITFLQKKEPACIHISRSHCHWQPKNYPSIYSYSRNKQPTCILYSCPYWLFFLFNSRSHIYLSYFPATAASVLICFTYVYTWYPLFIPFCIAVGWCLVFFFFPSVKWIVTVCTTIV